MGQMIQFGQKVQKSGIDRFDCAEGVTVKGVLLNYAQPYARNIAFDEVHRRFVECEGDMAVKYNLNPSPRYYFVVASFATDVNGNILGDKEQKVTFIQMKNKSYEEFVAQSNNLANWHGFVTLVKVPQKTEGKDYSYIKATPADDNAGGFNTISQALKDRIKSMIENGEFIATACKLIDDVTGMSREKYEQFLQNGQQQQAVSQGTTPQAVPQNTQQPAAQAAPKAVPQASQPAPQADDAFGAAASNDEDLPF